MTTQRLVDAYRAKPNRSEWDAGTLVTGLLAPEFDAASLDAGVDALKSRLPRTGTVGAAELCRFIADQGFVGAATGYYALDNSRLDRLLEHRRGIPITLAVLYIELGRAAGLAMRGIGFPGHFLVGANGALIDPFANAVIEPDAWRAWLRTHDLIEHAGAELSTAEPDQVALRMLNNAKRILFAGTEAAAVTALDMIDCQLALGGDPSSLHLERAELWRRFGSVSGVRAALADARDAATDSALRASIEARLVSIPRTSDPTTH